MLNVKQAAEKAKAYEPDRTITAVCDYDGDFYIFTMLKDPKVNDYNDPFYAVSKHDGKVYNFSPSGDFNKFGEAMQKRSIPLDILK